MVRIGREIDKHLSLVDLMTDMIMDLKHLFYYFNMVEIEDQCLDLDTFSKILKYLYFQKDEEGIF